MATLKNFANFNTVTVQGRVSNAEVVSYNGSEFLAVTLISTLETDGEEITVKFNTTNGLKTLFTKGYLPNGRLVTVTGQMTYMSSTYTNKDGEIITLKRPTLKLKNAIVSDGALGPIPSDNKRVKTVVTPGQVVKPSEKVAPVDATPKVEEFDFA